jgi:hypothetical protein
LTIDRHNTVTAGPQGRVSGTHLPGCPVTVTTSTKGIDVTDLPTMGNRFGSVTFKNNSPSAVTGIKFQWVVK